MARNIHTRWKIGGTLTAETPIHIGGMGGNADTDLALAINGQGNYYIPGTSLAGALRGWMGRSINEEQLKDVWGDHENDKRGASFIIIDDAQVKLLHGMTIEIREGVGIDRHTGTAVDKFKYSRAILPKGVTFPLTITLDCQTDQSPAELWNLLLALEKGDIRIGAAKTRGLGQVKLSNLAIHEQKFNADAIFDVLLKGGERHQWDNLKPQQYTAAAKLTLNINWKPKDPVMVKAEGDGVAVDILPLVSQVNQKVHFVIPGSSIKGVLRAHAERIVRTVCQKSTPDSFLEQVKLNLVNELFGAAEKSNTKQSQGKIAALSVDDCYATIPMTSEHWSAVENAAKSKNEEFKDFQATLKKAVLPKHSTENSFRILQPAMHVAVDRWTGGAADGMLYSVLEPIGVKWQPIGIHLDLERLKKYEEANVKPAIALLLLVLRDFANRKIPIGYGTNRGMGTVEVTEISMDCSPINGLVGIETETTVVPDLSNFNDQVLSDLTTAWQTWIAQNQEGA